MTIVEYDSLTDIFDKLETDENFVCDINRDTDLKVSKQNGYKIFAISLDESDPYFEPEDMHGMIIYTCLYSKFKDCKSIAIPFWRFNSATEKEEFNEWNEHNPYNIYVGNGYVNILCYKQDFEFLKDLSSKIEYGVLIISDGMYSTRYNSLVKLLSIIA